MTGPRCTVCGYRLEGMPGGADRCPECGSELPRGPGGGDRRGPSDTDRVRLVSGVELAWLGLLTFLPLPPIGAALDAAGWWRISRSLAPGVRELPLPSRPLLWWCGFAVRALSVLSVLATLLAFAAVVHVMVRGRTVWNSAVDETAIGLLIAAVPAIWAMRHVLGMALLVALARATDDPRLKRGAVASAVGGAAVIGSGFVLIGLGVLIFHVALFPPLCLILPGWIGAAAIWLVATLALLARLRAVLSTDLSTPPDNHTDSRAANRTGRAAPEPTTGTLDKHGSRIG